MYITTEQAEFIATIDVVETKSCRCACGESYAIVTDQGEMIVCDACYENEPNINR